MLHVKSYICFFAAVLLFQSCQKENASQGTHDGKVFVGGVDGGMATYWIDKKRVTLPGSYLVSQIMGIVVEGNNIHKSGEVIAREPNSVDKSRGAYWKNDVFEMLQGDSVGIEKLRVINQDVYICGYTIVNGIRVATYWKNGTPVFLETEPSRISGARDICIEGENVYVVGWQSNSIGNANAVIWINGITHKLDERANSTFAIGVISANGNVHISGTSGEDGGRAIYWKNGEMQYLSQKESEAGDITMDGADVFISGKVREGSEGYKITYWKNGVEYSFGEASFRNYASSIFINDGDIYIAGAYDVNGKMAAAYWKNGSIEILPSQSDRAIGYSIFVR